VVITFALSLPRDEASVPVVRHICRDALEALGVTRSCTEDIELAVTEACTNVLKHARGSREDYDVSVEIDEENCAIRVVDSGGGFDHATTGDEEAQGSAEGGRGIHLMRALVDSVSFVSKAHDGTTVHLEKALELTAGSLLRPQVRTSAGR
jgi:serine/threonine-protein kinase RsbW